MELSYIVNGIKVKELPLSVPNADFLAAQLPFLKRNYLQYARGEIHDFNNEFPDAANIHYTMMIACGEGDIRIYANQADYGSICLQASSPDGPWSLMMDGANPKIICTLPSAWNADAGFDVSYGIHLHSVIYNSYDHTTDGFFRGWLVYKKNSKYGTAFAKSQDGIDWFGYTECVFDDEITANLGSNQYIMGVYFDNFEQKYYAIINGNKTSGRGVGNPLCISSTDGINWSFVGKIPFMYYNETTDEFAASSLTKIGNLLLAGISRFDYTEGAQQVKNPVWAYSSDDGKTWNLWNIPFPAMGSWLPKYPSVYFTPNYIYLPFVKNPNAMCMARMEWNDNPAVITDVADITAQNTPSSGFYANQDGGKDIVITLRAMASGSANIDFDVYPFVALGNRRGSSNWIKGASCMKIERQLVQGDNVISFVLENVPYLWNFSITSKTEDVTISGISVAAIQKI